MGYFEAIKTCLRKSVSFSGRASRAEFWSFFIFAAIIVCFLLPGLSFLLAKLLRIGEMDTASSEVIAFVTFLVALLYFSIFVALTAASSRRLHDFGMSGWWAAPPIFLVMLYVAFHIVASSFFFTLLTLSTLQLGGSETIVFMDEGASVYIGGIFTHLFRVIGLYILGLLALCLKRSDPHTNRYGPPPADVAKGGA
ncbi:DUF805 domain-containing protein [Paracoccaceae bacterium GXU_MW_L88]